MIQKWNTCKKVLHIRLNLTIEGLICKAPVPRRSQTTIDTDVSQLWWLLIDSRSLWHPNARPSSRKDSDFVIVPQFCRIRVRSQTFKPSLAGVYT